MAVIFLLVSVLVPGDVAYYEEIRLDKVGMVRYTRFNPFPWQGYKLQVESEAVAWVEYGSSSQCLAFKREDGSDIVGLHHDVERTVAETVAQKLEKPLELVEGRRPC